MLEVTPEVVGIGCEGYFVVLDNKLAFGWAIEDVVSVLPRNVYLYCLSVLSRPDNVVVAPGTSLFTVVFCCVLNPATLFSAGIMLRAMFGNRFPAF